ncbi:ABC transporter permease ['Paenibacillus yunnanensis' Narsing Rao et al. 2020]|uniref:ABC transporter permease n=1 Tax=Paenibacillus tengchongensis TaxID=2608684 RepID=UPI00124D6481|nr:ABC transporter permease [Paenibacillus tengchongensis]
MRSFMALIKNNLRISILHKPVSFVLMTIAPIIVLLIASQVVSYSSSFVNVGIADADKSRASEAITQIVGGLEGIEVFYMNEDEVEAAFQSNKINVALVIEDGFQQGLLGNEIEKIRVIGNEEQNVYTLLQAILKNHLLNLRNLGKISSGDAGVFENSVDNYIATSEYVEKTSLNDLYTEYNNSNIFVGFLILFVFFNSSMIANVINTDRERNVYARIFLTPAKVWMYYLSNVLCNLGIAAFQILVAVLGMEYLTDSSIGIQPGVLFLILFLTAMVAVALGTFYVSITEEADAASMISNFANLLIVILGGCFIQVELFPKAIDIISYISPARWAMACILDLQQGMSLASIGGKTVLLGVMAVVILLIAILITSKREKKFRNLA